MCDLVGQHAEDGGHSFGRVSDRISLKGLIDVRQKIPLTAMFYGRSRGPPVLIVSPTKQLRELGREIGRFVSWQPVTQRLKNSAQQAIRTCFAFPAETTVEIVDPNVREMDCAIDALKTYSTHG